jgi:HPt (histidine-containing phosphotransfer) domain-containing protein
MLSGIDSDEDARQMLEKLRAVPGIDVDAGLAILGNSALMYARLLGRFVELHQVDVDALVRIDGKCEGEHLQRVCHTIKGGAATLGLPAVAQIAKELEQAFRDGAPREIIERLAHAMAIQHEGLRQRLQEAALGKSTGRAD